MLEYIAAKTFTSLPHFQHNATSPYASDIHHFRATRYTAAQHDYQKLIDAVNLSFALDIEVRPQYPTFIYEADFHDDTRAEQDGHFVQAPPLLDHSDEGQQHKGLLHGIGAQFL